MTDKHDEHTGSSKFQKLGLLLALAFYIVSVIMVFRIQRGGDILDKNVKTITFAHWSLEDGFREGFDEASSCLKNIKQNRDRK